jgi:hypothetical protein
MDYIKKICPICKNEFIVLNSVKEKAIYCTLKCLSESENTMNSNLDTITNNGFSFLQSQHIQQCA